MSFQVARSRGRDAGERSTGPLLMAKHTSRPHRAPTVIRHGRGTTDCTGAFCGRFDDTQCLTRCVGTDSALK